jgi:hypothetical protein
MRYDLGYFDDETCRLEPIENPFGPKVSPMSPAPCAADYESAESAVTVASDGDRTGSARGEFAGVLNQPRLPESTRSFSPRRRAGGAGPRVRGRAPFRWFTREDALCPTTEPAGQ